MTLSINSCHRLLLVAVLGFLLCAGCAGSKVGVKHEEMAARGTYRVAVFPIENLSGSKAPLKQLRQELTEKVKDAGFDLVSESSIDQFMARHRIRYIGGIDQESAQAVADEERADAVLISSLEYYADSFPPKMAMTARLVSTGVNPEIVWMENVALTGNDAPGAFDLGLIREAGKLADKALRQLVHSLSGAFSTGFTGEAASTSQKKFPPRQFYRSNLDQDKRFRIVVLPFYNRSGRKYAGEIMALHFVQELRRLRNFRPVEPGVVRHQLLQYRLIMDVGVSLPTADVIFDTLQANLLLTGKVLDYQDGRGETGIPTVDFSAMILDKEKHTLVLSSDSYNTGDDRVHFFDIGRINTASGVATEMVRGIVGRIGLRRSIAGKTAGQSGREH